MTEKPRSLPTGPKIEIIDPIAWQDRPIPERRWLVDNMIPMHNVTMLSGDGGVGKSIVTLQLMVACALGRQWLGRQTKPCKVFGLFAEDDEHELHRRLADICRHHGADLGDLENLQLCSRVGLENSMMEWRSAWEAGETTWLHATIMNHALEFGAQLVALDSLHDIFAGEENRRVQARQFVQGLREIAREIDGAVVLTAHPSLTGLNTGSGMSGSTAWSNAVRSRLYLTEAEEPTDGAERVLKTMKANYGPKGSEIRLRWDNGVYREIAEETGMLGSIKRGTAEVVFMECLEAVMSEGRNASESKHSGNYAPLLFAERPEGRGYQKEEFRRAMEALFHAGKIRVEPYGRVGDHRQRIVAVQPEKEGEDL